MSSQHAVQRTNEMSAAAALREMIQGYRSTQLIYVAAKLGIADLLKDGPKKQRRAGQVRRSTPPQPLSRSAGPRQPGHLRRER